MAKIKELIAHEVFNAKGNPTIEVTIVLVDGISTTASFALDPPLASYEAAILYDRDPSRFNGLGMSKAIQFIKNLVSPQLVGMEVTKQREIDKILIELDNTQNKSRLGANSLLPVSIAVAKAAAASSVLPLFLYLREYLTQKSTILRMPTPLVTILNGIPQEMVMTEFQEIYMVPASSKTFPEVLSMQATIRGAVEQILRLNNFSTLFGSFGGYAPAITTNYEFLSILSQAIESTSYRLGYDVFIGTNPRADNFYKNQQYTIKDKSNAINSHKLISFYQELVRDFRILYLADILGQDDWEGWSEATATMGGDAIIAGGDLIATNPYRLQMAIDKKAINAVIIKPHQIGTVIEALAVVEVAKTAGLKVIAACTEDETNDSFIADFAVAIGADYVKFGPVMQGEHVVKYNRLMQISERLKIL